MKNSNKILLSIIAIILLIILILQLKIKSHLKEIELSEIDLPFQSFNEIEAAKGWYIELHDDSITKVSINSDTIKNLISQDKNKLILNARKNDTKNRMIVKVYNSDISQIKLSGNSRMYFYIDSIDSLNIDLHEESDCILTNNKVDGSSEKEMIKQGKIGFLSIAASDNSSINVYCDVTEFQAELNDSSFCYVPSEVQIKKLVKSKNANFKSW